MNHGAACGNRNMTSTWLSVYKDTWVRGEHYGVCVRPQRTVSEADSGGEVEAVGVMGLPLRADTMNPAGLKHSFCLTSGHEVILSWISFTCFFFSKWISLISELEPNFGHFTWIIRGNPKRPERFSWCCDSLGSKFSVFSVSFTSRSLRRLFDFYYLSVT